MTAQPVSLNILISIPIVVDICVRQRGFVCRCGHYEYEINVCFETQFFFGARRMGSVEIDKWEGDGI